MPLIIKSMIFAFLITIPLGPMGFLIVREMFFGAKYRWAWYALGMAASDIFYSMVILLNLHHIQKFLLKFQLPLEIISGVILVGLGAVTLYKLAKVKTNVDACSDKKEYTSVQPLEAFMTAFITCLGNVSQAATFTLLFTSLGLVFTRHQNLPEMWFLMAYMVTVIATWLLIYRFAIYIKQKVTNPYTTIEKLSAWVILVSGVVLIGLAFVHVFAK